MHKFLLLVSGFYKPTGLKLAKRAKKNATNLATLNVHISYTNYTVVAVAVMLYDAITTTVQSTPL